MTAGWLAAGDTARPGYGWFFGRDTLWSLYAVNSYGDFALSRSALEFLLAQQRADGKIMHEMSQTAGEVDWGSMPYLYAAADSTPLMIMAMDDYVRSSGDVEFLGANWERIQRAWQYMRAHTTVGAMDNSAGTGWVEEWLPHKPDQEAYLVALDAQSDTAMMRLAQLMHDDQLAAEARKTEAHVGTLLDSYRNPKGLFRFSRNHDGSFEEVQTVFPTVAWWTGDLAPSGFEKMFSQWASHTFTADWGVRSVGSDQAIYDPISYHHGSVWPLFTGWTAMAEYRTGRSLEAYEHLRSNLMLTWLEDPGAVTELLSGEFYRPFARSSSHQMWSSAMVVSPAVRGLFGLEADALHHAIAVSPHLPAAWDYATLRHFAVGTDRYTVNMRRSGNFLEVDAVSDVPTRLCLAMAPATQSCKAAETVHHSLQIPLPAVEVGLEENSPQEGMRSQQMHVLNEVRTPHRLELVLEAPAESKHFLDLRKNERVDALKIVGGVLQGDQILVTAPNGDGYQTMEVTLTW